MNPARRRRSGRQSTASSVTDSAAPATIANAVDTTIGRPRVAFAKYPANAPNVIRSPYAKLTSRRIPYTSEMPTAAIA